MLNATFQSHPIKMGCCSTNEKSLIVITINTIWRSRPVQPSTKFFSICSLKSKENIIFAHNYYFKQNTKEAHCSLQFHLSISFFLGRLGTSNQL